jgi:hypothetical protein
MLGLLDISQSMQTSVNKIKHFTRITAKEIYFSTPHQSISVDTGLKMWIKVKEIIIMALHRWHTKTHIPQFRKLSRDNIVTSKRRTAI